MSARPSVSLYYGDEDFLIDEEVSRARSAIAPGGDGMNYEVLDGSSATAEQLVNSIMSSPFLGGGKLVVVKDLPQFEPELTGILGKVPQGVHVIFSVRGSVDKRKKLFKLIDRVGEVKEFRPFAEWEQEKLLAWIVKRVSSSGKSIGSHAARLLMETSGANMRALALEIEKLATYVGERAAIEEDDVRALASAGRLSVFSLIEAVRKRDLRASLEALSRLIRDREDPHALLGLMARQLRMMLQVKSLKQARRDYQEIAGILGERPFFVRKSLEGADNFSLEELKRSLDLLHKADLDMKSGYSSVHTILEVAIIEIVGRREHVNN